ncbi:MAG: amidohydrolase family protein [Deltaproteobacteria bacterium]|nr:amidohydrolase family protein [Deltaproteobacteria bacterium]
MPEINPANRHELDYHDEAARLAKLNFPIVDVHTHVNGSDAVKVYSQVAKAFGIGLTYSMTYLENMEPVRSILGKSVRFIAMPRFSEEERYYKSVGAYMKHVEAYYLKGARILKLWAAPRGIDIGKASGCPDLFKLSSPRRIEIINEACGMNMVLMTHVGDPDTWFKTMYQDCATYGEKVDQYKPLEELLAEYTVPWIAAHMGGWPEDLEFLSGLLARHPNLYLDTSATKWMVRELSRHSRQDLIRFLTEWRERILFGSDITVKDEDLLLKGTPNSAASLEAAFELYASRYWSLRTLFESDYSGESPISDPDLAQLEPQRYSPFDAPLLQGKALPAEIIHELYYGAAARLLDGYYVA